ncbi:LA2681 family HEPN domain-containing protein [Thauera sp. Sel9]|uniref:LA2681 family HEPN domain-containing protein n=1 Tax=Thauera sp. Sel9 TaxID=2974299 RepID=UPI0021E13A7B|nr:LA2681 family HEPN domain-containing protein [Thauera sp. Sel9]MCV2217737.1 LA2681 family HEPN domain-containing protein [Thauera sp. Sel9]
MWNFEQLEIQQQIFLLRRAAHGSGFAAMEPVRRCQILTNLGNQFDALGRFVEARACWSAALAIDPRFWMAKANRGRGLMYYAAALYDPGHEGVFAYHAYRDLAKAVELINLLPHLGDPGVQRAFVQAAKQIAQHYDLEAIGQSYRPDAWSLGESPTEQAYRRWCLKHTLFLNPLNDVDPVPIAAQDVLSLPDFTLPAGKPPIVTGMFNELKQLFVSARWLLWEGTHAEEAHFSDREVLLFNTLDYPSYGLSLEKVKMAFRLGYSLFDKIAYFLNFYLGLGVAEHQVSFRTIWREKKGGPLRVLVANSENWPLRGLYWLSKDLFEKEVKDTTEPEARALAELRNHLEHKYVKVCEMSVPLRGKDHPFHDTLAYYVTRLELEQKTLRLLQLVRSALVYLSLARRSADGPGARRG